MHSVSNLKDWDSLRIITLVAESPFLGLGLLLMFEGSETHTGYKCEYVLQRCNRHQPERIAQWPSATPLHQKLYGGLEDYQLHRCCWIGRVGEREEEEQCGPRFISKLTMAFMKWSQRGPYTCGQTVDNISDTTTRGFESWTLSTVDMYFPSFLKLVCSFYNCSGSQL